MTTRTVLNPLTTTFTPPASCTTLNVASNSGQLDANWGQTCLPHGSTVLEYTMNSDCFPSGFDSWMGASSGDSEAWLTTVAVYSPAIGCPSGWEAACSVSRPSGAVPPPNTGLSTAAFDVYNQLLIGETAFACCPSGYTCASDDWKDCVSSAKIGDTISGTTNTDSCSALPTSYTKSANQDLPEYSAYAVWLLQGADASAQASASKTGGSSTSTVYVGSHSGSSNSISAGAKIAIGVIIPLVVIAAAVVAFLVFRRKKRNLHTQHKAQQETKPELEASTGSSATGPSGQAYSKPELDSKTHDVSTTEQPTSLPASHETSGKGMDRSHELSSSAPVSQNRETSEMEATVRNVAELPDTFQRFELEAPDNPKNGQV